VSRSSGQLRPDPAWQIFVRKVSLFILALLFFFFPPHSVVLGQFLHYRPFPLRKPYRHVPLTALVGERRNDGP